MERDLNIGPRGRRRRRRLGWVMLAAAGVLLAGPWWGQAPRPARLILFAPLWLAALGFLQARAAT